MDTIFDGNYPYVRPLPKHTHTRTRYWRCSFQSCCWRHSVELFLPPLLATFTSHYDKVPRLQVCTFSATICGQRKVAAGEEMDGEGKVMDTGSLARFRAPTPPPHPPGISRHCLAPRFPGTAFDCTGGEVRIWHREGFTSAITIGHRQGGWWLFVSLIVGNGDCLMEVRCALCEVFWKGIWGL